MSRDIRTATHGYPEDHMTQRNSPLVTCPVGLVRRIGHLTLGIGVCLWLACGAAPGVAQSPTPDPRFGIVETFVNAEAATAAGAGYTRIILRWDVIQPANGADWKPANVPDPFIEQELAAGREVVGMLIGTPGSNDPRAVPDMAFWERFVRLVVQQYQGRIRHWVIWNEPDVWDATHPGSTWLGSEEDYFHLLKTAYLAIKDIDPTLQVHLAGLTYFWDQQHARRQYLDRLLDVILADPDAPAHGLYFDGVIYHLYYKPLQAPQIIGEIQSMLGGRGIMAKELWINETNAPPSQDAQEPPHGTPRFRVSLEEQSAFLIQEFSLAFASGANRVEFYKLRNSIEHPESVEPYGLLRGDDSRRPVFDAYRTLTTYLGGFRSAQWERFGNVHVVTFDRGDSTTTVLWTMGRTATRFTLNAIAPGATLVDEQGNAREVAASDGTYTLELPGASCTEGGDCFIGGAPRLLVEVGAPGARPGIIPLALLTPTPTSPAVPTATPVLAPSSQPPTAAAEPTLFATPVTTPPAAPTATLPPSTTIAPSTPEAAEEAARQSEPVVPMAQPVPLPTPLPAVTPITILTPARCLVLGLVGLAVFIVTYGLQMSVIRRLRH
jgi:hypothetical protein